MKRNRNRYRQAPSNVQTVEKSLSMRERFFSALTYVRAKMQVYRALRMALIVLPVALLLFWGIRYIVTQAYRMGIDNVSYESTHKIITREQALDILGIHGSINLAGLNPSDWERKLEENPSVASAHIHAELPDTLHIELEERIPVVYVEMESGADTGTRQKLYMDQNGCLFPVVAEYHTRFTNVPVWYLQPGDIREFRVGEAVAEKSYRPIVELVAAANHYSLQEIPSIREIFRPKEWKIILTLETGAEVLMQVYDIKGQMERLAMIVEHAAAVRKHPVSINVIPRINPTVTYAEERK